MIATEKQLHLKWDFYFVWFAFAVVAGFFHDTLARQLPWVAQIATVIMASLFATLICYGPVLIVQHTLRAGRAAQVLLGWAGLVFAVAVLACGSLLYFQHDKPAQLVGAVFGSVLSGLLIKLARCPKV